MEFSSDGMPAVLVVHEMAPVVSLGDAFPPRDSAYLEQIRRRTQGLDRPWQHKIGICEEIYKD